MATDAIVGKTDHDSQESILLTSVIDFIRDETQEHGFKILRISLVLITGGVLLWQGVGFWIPDEPVALKKTSVATTDYQIGKIKEANLFGPAPEQNFVSGSSNLPETTLQMTLRGVMTAAVQTDASAIIEAASQPASYYKVNSSLPGGARLVEVYPNRVIIARSGLKETLYFPDKLMPVTDSAQGQVPIAEQIISAADTLKKPQVSLRDLPPDEKTRQIRERLEQLRDR